MSEKKVKITLVLLMFLSFRAIRKKRFCWIMGSRKLRLHVFMKHMAHMLRRAKSNKNASRVRSEDFM